VKLDLVSNSGDMTRKTKGPHCNSREVTFINADSRPGSYNYDQTRFQKNFIVTGIISTAFRKLLENITSSSFYKFDLQGFFEKEVGLIV
jgi:hypothetical protein